MARPPANRVTHRARRTAELMAIQRALESTRPPAERLFVNPLAPAFVSPAWRVVLSTA